MVQWFPTLKIGSWWSLLLLMSFWLAATPAASAEAIQANLTLEAETSPTFRALIQQAELLAEKSVAQAFEQPNVTEVLIRVAGDRYGQSVPLLTVKVGRSDWQKNPNIRAQARYYNVAARLLNFGTQVAQAPGASTSRIFRSSEDDPAFRDD
jgi:hypothetical protein